MAANQSTTRIHNKREIIDALISCGEMSRASLSKMLALSKPATAEHVEYLIELDLVHETGEGFSTNVGGRKPRLLRLNTNYRVFAAIDISLTHPVLAIGNLTGEMLSKKRLQNLYEQSSNEKKDTICQTIHLMMKELSIPLDKLGTIIISSPGIFQDNNRLLLANPQFRGWTDIGLDGILSSHFSVPVVIKNDVNAAALGEYSLGCGKGSSNMLFASCGIGFGSGIIIDGALHEGKNFAAGEIGYFTNHERYSKDDFIESTVNLEALFRKIHADLKADKVTGMLHELYKKNGVLKFDDVVSACENFDPYTLKIVKKIGEEIGFVLANIATLLDIERLVIGGEYKALFHSLKKPIEAIINKCVPVPPLVLSSELGENAGLYGGFIFARNRLFDNLEL